MTSLDYAVVGAYLAGMVAIGAVLSRRIGSFRDFFVAAGRLTAPLLICSLVSTYYGLDVLFGGSEVAYQEGVVAWFGYTRPYYIVILVGALLVAPRLKRHDFLSLPDVAEHYYGRGTRAVTAVACFLYALPLLSIMGIGILLDVLLAGLRGLFVAGVLATAMSTIDSYLLIAGGNIAYDVYRPFVRPEMDDAAVLRLTRWMTAAAAAAAVAFALFFRTVVSAWIFMSTVLIAAALVPLLAGLYSRRPQPPAAGLAASVTGLGVAVLFYVLVHLYGRYDEEWATQIWTLGVGGRSIELWQEYAVLFALPASALAFLAARLLARSPARALTPAADEVRR